MRRYLFILLFFISTGVSAQIKNPEFKALLDSLYSDKVPLLSVEEFIKMNKEDVVYVLDAREEEEYRVSHLKNARNIGYFWFDMRKIYDIPTEANVIVYCTIGSRSEKIAEKLIEAGYSRVFNLYGGILEWINEGQPVYKKDDIQTSEIHTYTKALEKWVDRGTKVN